MESLLIFDRIKQDDAGIDPTLGNRHSAARGTVAYWGYSIDGRIAKSEERICTLLLFLLFLLLNRGNQFAVSVFFFLRLDRSSMICNEYGCRRIATKT